ncbi:hypothetical protein [Agarilytica rhodophyticola]|uniref:hypothetical protein n=1 Tax=Agarilytica rhodophyticola TaxID=1737490 RepID=UPI000B341BD0|nr:hypothetical protein [Agarilytica rhodophyticola]
MPIIFSSPASSITLLESSHTLATHRYYGEYMNKKVKLSYPQVKSRYQELRQQSLGSVYNSFPETILNKRKEAVQKTDISLNEFDMDCRRALKKWEKEKNRRLNWDWREIESIYRADPRRFELAIWYRNNVLCSASLGKPTWSGGKLRLDYIEANPAGSPLDGRATDIAILAATLYAEAIGATQLRITKPVNDQVRDYYLSKSGFSHNRNEDFCFKDL